MDQPVIPCDRCGKPGGIAHKGWNLLCDPCAIQDELEFWEDKLDPWER